MAPFVFRSRHYCTTNSNNNMSNLGRNRLGNVSDGGTGTGTDHSSTSTSSIRSDDHDTPPNSASFTAANSVTKPSSGDSTQSCSSSSEERHHQQQQQQDLQEAGRNIDSNIMMQASSSSMNSPKALSSADETISHTQNSPKSSLSLPQHLAIGIPAEEVDDSMNQFHNKSGLTRDSCKRDNEKGTVCSNTLKPTPSIENHGTVQNNGNDDKRQALLEVDMSAATKKAFSREPSLADLNDNNNNRDNTSRFRQSESPQGSSTTSLSPRTPTAPPVLLSPSSAGPRPQRTSLKRESSMTERVNKLRSSATNRPVRLTKKPLMRSKSDIPRTMNRQGMLKRSNDEDDENEDDDDNDNDNHDVQQDTKEGTPVNKSKKIRSFSSSPISKYNNDLIRATGKNGYGRPSRLPTTNFARSVTESSIMGINHPQNNTGAGAANRSRRRTSSGDLLDVPEEDESGEDVLLLIAKARAKLGMQGSTGDNEVAGAEAEAVLAQLQQHQRQQEREEMESEKGAAAGAATTATSGSSIRSGGNSAAKSAASSSWNGSNSLPGAYEKRPGGGFERKETFSHASISLYSESAQMRSGSAMATFDGSDIESISSDDSGSTSDVMEIEFSQQSFSNNDDDDRKPAAIDNSSAIGSACFSLAANSLGLEEVFNQPMRRLTSEELPSRRQTPVNRARSFGGQSAGDDDGINRHSSYASMPVASAPTTFSDNDSNASSVKQKRRQRRFNRHNHHRRRRQYHEKAFDTKKSSLQPMKDGSNESNGSQLVIAAEVVRSEEEMVEELREKVEQEILESMAKELHEMEASMSAITSDVMDLSHFSMADTPHANVERGLLLSRMSYLQSQQTVPNRVFGVPPSPLPTTSMQRTQQRMGLSNITPDQSRRIRSLNLSGASPQIMRIPGRGGRRTQSVQQTPRNSRSLQDGLMPQLQTSLDEECSSSSDSDNIHTIVNIPSVYPAPANSVDVVDAVDVVPASPPPPTAARAQSQPIANRRPLFSSGGPGLSQRRSSIDGYTIANRHRLASSGGTERRSSIGGPTPILNHLRSLAPPLSAATSTNASMSASNAGTGALQRRSPSGSSQVSLPDLVAPQPPPPPFPERNSTGCGSAVSRASVSSCNMSHQERRQQSRRGSYTSSVHSRHSSSADSSIMEYYNNQSQYYNNGGDDQNGYFINTRPSDVNVNNVHNMPGHWDLQQSEMAELGLAITQEGGQQLQDQDLINNTITYDDQVPLAWLTPVGLLVCGAIVLGLVLFAV